MIVCTMPGCQTTAGCRCTGLVRHRNPEKFAGDPEFYPKEVARLTAALEAAQARIEAVRRETVTECARIAEVQPFYPDTHTGMRQAWVKSQIAAAIRALTEAKEDHIPDARKMVEAKEDRT